MEKELDSIVIRATQTSLGKYVKRPQLTEKLLKKPPFRFLHDIVTSVQKSTGFFDDLFDKEELVSDNVKDRESKIIFLNKVITVVGLVTGKVLSVKPSKIVAGQEPDKTNELLQCLAQALDNNLSSVEAVKKFKEGVTLSKPDDKKIKESLKSTKKTNDTNKLTSRSNDKFTSLKKESNPRTNKTNNDKTTLKPKLKEKIVINTESPPKKVSHQTKRISNLPSVEKTENKDKQEGIGSNGEAQPKISDTSGTVAADTNNKNNERFEDSESIKDNNSVNTEDSSMLDLKLNSSYTIINNLNSSLSSDNLQRPENDKNNEISEHHDDLIGDTLDSQIITANENKFNDENRTEINSRLTSEPQGEEKNIKEEEKRNVEAPIIKSHTNIKNIIRPKSVRPSSSRPGAPRLRDKHDNVLSESDNILVGKVNIITENTPNEEEEDTTLIIIDQDPNSSKAARDEQEQLLTSLNQHGHLVQQILDSQKEYSQISGKTEIEWEFGAQKVRDAYSKQIEKLRFDIQGLSRVANPLGKLLDHIQEDVEVMRQELHQWTKTYQETNKELYKQKAANEDCLFPLRTKVKQLSADILEKRDKINDLKIIVHKNSIRVEKLLLNGNVQ